MTDAEKLDRLDQRRRYLLKRVQAKWLLPTGSSLPMGASRLNKANHQCVPPRWPDDTANLARCRWFGHRVKVIVRCCRYVLTCERCHAMLADLPRSSDRAGSVSGSLPFLFESTPPCQG